MIAVDFHPRLRYAAFLTRLPAPLGELTSPLWLTELLRPSSAAPLEREESVRTSIRDLLRHGGYKPTGRGKPASEYLVRAAERRELASINLAVDACNAVSLHSGLPISMIDIDRAEPPLRITTAAQGDHYVFNAAGQTIDLKGLLCLFDAQGPCANAVKDSQRTKTTDETQSTLSLIWACAGLEERLARAVAWYRELLERAGASTELEA
jgi:DNA/RNA-binding domain of Phe-tRNA-synthetase-like protein